MSNDKKTMEDVRNLIVCDTQFGWTGSTTLRLQQMLALQERGWLAEGAENNEFDLTDAGRDVVARALQSAVQPTLADVQPGGRVRLATVPYDRARDLIGDAYNAGTHGIGYSQQAMELHHAIIPAQPSPGGQGDAWDIAELVRTDLDRQSCPDAYMRIAMESVVKHLAARQPVGEPVAWLLISEAGTAIGATRHARERESWEAAGGTTEPLYATPRVQDVDGYRAAFYELAEMLSMTAQPWPPKEVWETQMRPALQAAISAQGPVPMVLHCPRCHLQHIDAPDERTPDWQNPPHRSHLCHGCGLIWRPADVPTIGVEHTQTAGRGDSHFSPDPTGAQAPIGFANPHHLNDTSTDGVILRKKGEFFTVPVYTSPTAQAVDLAQFREPIAAWSKHCAHSIKGYESYQDSDLPDWMAERRQQVRKCGELLALIDSQAVGK